MSSYASFCFLAESVVLPNRGEKYYYYHRKLRRVPEIDECYEGDVACIYEANHQFKKDKSVQYFFRMSS